LKDFSTTYIYTGKTYVIKLTSLRAFGLSVTSKITAVAPSWTAISAYEHRNRQELSMGYEY